MTSRIIFRTATLVALVVAFGLSATVFAETLAELRAAGTAGERFDGLVVVRDLEASDEVEQTLAEINRQRLEIYQKRAEEQGVTVEQVGAVYAASIRQDAPVGTWFLDREGAWSEKTSESSGSR